MRIGITYDLKESEPAHPDGPDDLQEEFDSPTTIETIAAVLRRLGHEVIKLGNGRSMLERLLADPPGFVFNFAEGQGVSRSREARVPAVLEMLGIPYTGSDPLTLAATLDKDCAKRLVASVGVSVPRGAVCPVDEPMTGVSELHPSLYPVLVKPAWEGSSKGIRSRCLVEKSHELAAVIEEMRHGYRQPLLLEEYIEGDELTVGVLGNPSPQPLSPAAGERGRGEGGRPQILGIMRVLPMQASGRFIYSVEVKRDYLRQVSYECPAALSPHETEEVSRAALKTFHVLGCRDVARIDFRLRGGIPYFLEVNPLPGLNPESSDLVIMAKLVGWSYEQLIESILQAAFQRCGLATK